MFILDRFWVFIIIIDDYFYRGLILRILIAEDDATSQELLKLNLESWGYQVVACDDGGQALQAMSELGSPRLAVLDWMMPELSGVDVCRLVRELDHGRLIYIILLTAKNQREDLLEGLEAGADDYVTKPFDRQELKARLQVGARVVELQGKLMEAEKSRVLAETAGAASHEINQPLTIALGKLDLLMMKMGDESPFVKDVDAIQNAVHRIEEIVRKMGSARKYVTKPYIQGIDIVDFDASAEN